MRTFLIIIMVAVSAVTKSQTITEVRNELRKQGIPCADIVLAKARLETGNFTSERCKRDHNIFGIKHRGRYAVYRNWRESVADYKERISSRYTGGDYYAFLRRIGYASDDAYCRKVANIVRTSK